MILLHRVSMPMMNGGVGRTWYHQRWTVVVPVVEPGSTNVAAAATTTATSAEIRVVQSSSSLSILASWMVVVVPR